MREAGRIAIRERAAIKKELKPDGSLVTSADRAIETFLSDTLTKLIPGTAVFGEEFGRSGTDLNGTWFIDPIDGTTNYSHGGPQWGSAIALLRGADIALGAVYLPDAGEAWVSAPGSGVMVNGRRLPPIPPGPIAKHDTVCYSESVSRLQMPIPGKMRCSGAFVTEAAAVCKQWSRGMVCIRESLYDVAACILFASELGAEIRYLDGRPLDIENRLNGERFESPWLIFPANSGFFVG